MIRSTTKSTIPKLPPKIWKPALLHLHPQIRRGLESKNYTVERALGLHEIWSARYSHQVHPSIRKAAKFKETQQIHRKIRQGNLPAYVFGMSLDPKHRLFAEKLALPGPAETNYINHVIGNLQPNRPIGQPKTKQELIIISSDNQTKKPKAPLNVLKWFELLVRNHAPGGDELAKLRALGLAGQNHQAQGGNLGAWCERRFGLAAAKLQDAGFIEDFAICGEASLPLIVPGSATSPTPSINYANHEEAMAIDAMIKLKSVDGLHRYALIQIKAGGSCGYDTQKRFLVFDKKQMEAMEYLNKNAFRLFRKHDEHPGEFLLPVKRRVFKIPIAHHKMQKTDRFDNSDIVNTTIAVLDHMIKHNEILTLDRPYSSLKFPERVNALLDQGFLKLHKFTRQEQKPVPQIIY